MKRIQCSLFLLVLLVPLCIVGKTSEESNLDAIAKLREWRSRHRAPEDFGERGFSEIAFHRLSASVPVNTSSDDAVEGVIWEEPAVFQTARYLPPAGWDGGETRDHDTACIEEMLDDLREQHRKCEKGLVSSQVPPWGFAATFRLMILQLQRVRRLDKIMRWHGEHLYVGCEGGDVSCAFPMTECRGNEEDFSEATRLQFEDAWVMEARFGECFLGTNALFRYVSALAGHVFTLQPRYAAMVDGVSGRIGLPERYLGVHIRHGDSCIAPPTHDESDARKESQAHVVRFCHGIPDFADALWDLAAALNVSAAYIASDNPQALVLLSQMLPHMQFFWNPDVEREWLAEGNLGDGASDLGVHMIEHKLRRSPLQQRQRQLDQVTADAGILSRSAGLALQLSSNMARLYLELASHTQMRVVPYISVDDSRWCWGNHKAIKCPS